MSSAFDPFVSFVVKPFCTSARGTSFPSRPFVALTQAAKVSRHQVSRHKIAKESWFSLSACLEGVVADLEFTTPPERPRR